MTRATRLANILAVSLGLLGFIGGVFSVLHTINCERDHAKHDADCRAREQQVYNSVDERIAHMETRWDLTYSMAKKSEFQIDDLWMWHRESQIVDNMLKTKTEYLEYYLGELNAAFQEK